MPTYDYVCPKCGFEFEAFQSMSDKPLTKCPSCKKTGVKRLIGPGAGFVFKGTGFYETDFKTKKGKPPVESAPKETKACENCACKNAGESK
ncbi:FmdB family zinc ribbon protein [Ereboglobus luteus]|uniref:FmdB family transcriptional regulator n=1 Tax=Ereboglobus luteus TaxID=1796921 RepID=A0A2U8E681_9BACT|nr:zinc ribbon domain-containing protein [Ereboglobus luteus]AWI10064.1 FmdB family transcriptional regulator [Ereboglobus luteus]